MILIGITGKAGSGKDTVADIICGASASYRYSFAGPLKDAYKAMFGKHPNAMSRNEKEEKLKDFDFSPREAMQKLGTEWGRSLDSEMWLKMAKKEYKVRTAIDEHKVFLVTDVRFDNEAEWVSKNGILIEVLRDSAIPVLSHKSESGVSGEPDFKILNNQKIEDLKIPTYYILSEIGLFNKEAANA
jgi:hypothetical protein